VLIGRQMAGSGEVNSSSGTRDGRFAAARLGARHSAVVGDDRGRLSIVALRETRPVTFDFTRCGYAICTSTPTTNPS
jgi:hypothetical protein